MARTASPETQLLRLKSEYSKLLDQLDAAQQRGMQYRERATKAEQDVAEWKARFDALLHRTPKVDHG